MSFIFLNSIYQRLSLRLPSLFYAATWTTLLTIIVAVASFSPELAFVSAITPSSSFSQACHDRGSVRIPLDLSLEVFCFPTEVFQRSKMDLLVPPIFAATIVAVSAYVVKALALWEVDGENNQF
ncbi:PREDICTED: uncharacterized protein LOC109220275 [Nicotiana attenuata]|uniref:Uncharacterized protein n=1 Tax=Nicotiana attenuata TaxID=49451 RepID=A0A1J6JT56_NICAT|nr:PREDICTED: uncharacterized protein LOC109220275 [Nicotiana attenuata]OIT20366.1 hypothetical protein A4A49_58496 [Nicotiana attenuata]